MTKRSWGYVVVLAFLMWGCANVVPPTGGPRDTEPPVLKIATPPSGSVRFDAQIIELTFSEYIRIQNPSQIRISPALEKPPRYTERFNILTIDLGDAPLAPNTTYTLNFGDALTDLNESNKLSNFKYVFSTGEYLDSLLISGVVEDAVKAKPIEQVLVGLYPGDSLIDGIPGNTKPFYFIKTDKQGKFQLENLRSGYYGLLAFDDKNGNLLYDKTEEVAFVDSMLFPDTSAARTLSLRLFANKDALLKVTEKRSVEPGWMRLRFATPIDSFRLRPLLGVSADSIVWWHQADSVWIFHQALRADSLVLACYFDGKNDTLVINNRKAGDRVLKTAAVRLFPGNQPSVLEPITLLLNRPFGNIEPSLFQWKTDTTVLDSLPFRYERMGNVLRIWPQLLPNKRYELFVAQGAVSDWFDMPVDTFRFAFSSVSEEAFGSLLLENTDSIATVFTHVELLNEQYEVVRRMPLERGKPQAFQQLRPLSYRIRLLADANGNGKWDTGNYGQKTQPEQVWYYPEAVSIRANWEVGIGLGGAPNK